MQTKYTNPNISFHLGNYKFTILNLVFERFLRSIPKHSHSDHSYEIHYISAGKGTAIINKKSYSLSAGTLYVTGPSIEHEQIPNFTNPMEEYCIYLKLEQEKKSSQHIPSSEDLLPKTFKETNFWFQHKQDTFSSLFEALFLELSQQEFAFLPLASSILQQIIIQLTRCYLVSNSSNVFSKKTTNFAKEDLYRQKFLIIEESFLYDYKNLSLTMLASRIGLSTRQTERLLKQHYGQTFSQMRNQARMSYASVLLTRSEKSVTEISQDVGYSSIEHFSSAFHNFYHCSPRTYRDHYKQSLKL